MKASCHKRLGFVLTRNTQYSCKSKNYADFTYYTAVVLSLRDQMRERSLFVVTSSIHRSI